jgi:hypothetical protein
MGVLLGWISLFSFAGMPMIPRVWGVYISMDRANRLPACYGNATGRLPPSPLSGLLTQASPSEVVPNPSPCEKAGALMLLEAILHEVDQLHNVSSRLEGLAEHHPPVSEALLRIAGNVRNTATILAVVVAAKGPKPI